MCDLAIFCILWSTEPPYLWPDHQQGIYKASTALLSMITWLQKLYLRRKCHHHACFSVSSHPNLWLTFKLLLNLGLESPSYPICTFQTEFLYQFFPVILIPALQSKGQFKCFNLMAYQSQQQHLWISPRRPDSRRQVLLSVLFKPRPVHLSTLISLFQACLQASVLKFWDQWYRFPRFPKVSLCAACLLPHSSFIDLPWASFEVRPTTPLFLSVFWAASFILSPLTLKARVLEFPLMR